MFDVVATSTVEWSANVGDSNVVVVVVNDVLSTFGSILTAALALGQALKTLFAANDGVPIYGKTLLLYSPSIISEFKTLNWSDYKAKLS